eukprot:768431-Hanusia_phi.AAC.21
MEHDFSYVGYDPNSDKAIVQFGNETNARLVPAHDLLKTFNHGESKHWFAQLIHARRAPSMGGSGQKLRQASGDAISSELIYHERSHTSFSYVGYDPKSDKAIVQYSDEPSARLVRATCQWLTSYMRLSGPSSGRSFMWRVPAAGDCAEKCWIHVKQGKCLSRWLWRM